MDWYEKILVDTAVRPAFPLWHYPREQLLKDMCDAEFETLIVSLKPDKLEGNLLGKRLTPETAELIKKQGVCPTGEDGEFHTLVLNGPHFRFPLQVDVKGIREDEWGYRQLDIVAL